MTPEVSVCPVLPFNTTRHRRQHRNQCAHCFVVDAGVTVVFRPLGHTDALGVIFAAAYEPLVIFPKKQIKPAAGGTFRKNLRSRRADFKQKKVFVG